MRRFTLLALNIVTWVLIGVMGTDESNLLSLSDVSTETQNKMPKLPIESPQPTNGNTMVGELADEGTLETMDPTSTADDEMGSKQSSHSGTGASMSGPSRVVGSKVDELLSMNDDKLVEVPHDLLLSLIRSHLAQSAIKDASTAKRGVVEDKAEDSPMTADAQAEQIVAKENEVRTLRALLVALRKEYNQLLEQQWDDEQERKRKEEENKWLQQWDDTSNNLQDSIQDLSYNAALVEAAATEEQYERADRAGFIMIIVAGSIAVALVIIGVVVFALYADRRKAEEASTYELHQSLNDSAA